MTAAILIAKLVEVEKAVGNLNPSTIRRMVLEAQGCVLEMDQEMIEMRRDNRTLRQRMENYERSTAAGSMRLTSV